MMHDFRLSPLSFLLSYLWCCLLIVPLCKVYLSSVQELLIMLVFVSVISKYVRERELCPFLFCSNVFLSNKYK